MFLDYLLFCANHGFVICMIFIISDASLRLWFIPCRYIGKGGAILSILLCGLCLSVEFGIYRWDDYKLIQNIFLSNSTAILITSLLFFMAAAIYSMILSFSHNKLTALQGWIGVACCAIQLSGFFGYYVHGQV